MDVNYILLLFVAVIVALAYGLPGIFSDWLKNGSKVDLPRFGATIIYSIVVGFIAVQTGVLNLENIVNWQTVLTPVWQLYLGFYLMMLYAFQKIVVPVVQQFTSKMVIYPKREGISPDRKMDAETKGAFFNGQREEIRVGLFKAVDAAEALKTVRYAIEAGAWIYLVEFGEICGTKHYYFRGWFGTQVVSWKPITPECLETIRKTGRFPDYFDLY